jgi:phage FluMu protein Com
MLPTWKTVACPLTIRDNRIAEEEMKCPKCKHIDYHAEWCQTTADSNSALIDGLDDNSTAPIPELEGTYPVVLYFGNEEDRDEFMAIVQEAKPGMITRKL